MARTLTITAVLAFLVAALAASAGAETEEPIVVTRDTQRLPRGCAPRETAQLLVRFANAVSTGDMAALDQLFAIDDPLGRVIERSSRAFVWFSVTEGQVGARQPWRHLVFYDRVDVFPYFAERRRHDERWELVSVVVGPSHTDGAAGITYTIRRTANDLPSWLSPLSVGKGAVDCVAQRIYVWSMGQNDHSVDVAIGCPRPPNWSPGVAVVACSRGPNARAIARDFQLEAGSARLPRPCSPTPAYGRLRSTLASFNAGLGTDFARRFVARRALFHPYTASAPQLVGRASIARFVGRRYVAGDGWTGTALHAPRRAVGRTAVFRIDLLLSSLGKPFTSASAKVVFDCASGLIRAWRGPAVAAP